MSRHIRIDFAKIDNFYQHDSELERKAQILMRKEAIYSYRNQLLTNKMGQLIGSSDFAISAHGKPYLKSQNRQGNTFSFNHSHSQSYYVLASSTQQQDLGIDIEQLDRSVRFDALAQHAFHPNEYKKWQDLACDPEYWFKVWTTKEAILKAHGLGIRMSLNTLDTALHPQHDGGFAEHERLGVFAYQNFNIQNCIITVAWRSERSCKGFALPKIEMIQH